jgi:hypothetical protein
MLLQRTAQIHWTVLAKCCGLQQRITRGVP